MERSISKRRTGRQSLKLSRMQKIRTTQNQRKHLESLGEQLGLKTMEEWYSITESDIRRLCGGSVLDAFQGGLYNTLTALFPQHSWKIWKFARVPNGHWKDLGNQKDFMNWFRAQ